jgi:hypothetical protein
VLTEFCMAYEKRLPIRSASSLAQEVNAAQAARDRQFSTGAPRPGRLNDVKPLRPRPKAYEP